MPRLRSFEPDAWSTSRTDPVPSTRIKVPLTLEHIERATWSLHRNPVSLALRPLLNEESCATMYWNSDSPSPLYHDDDARIGIHVETRDGEQSYWLPLPVRATRALWRLRSCGIEAFQPLIMSLDVPQCALVANREPAPST